MSYKPDPASVVVCFFLFAAAVSLCFIVPAVNSAGRSQPLSSPVAEPLVDSIRVISIPANDIILNPGDGKIYASVPSSAGHTGNSIASIDPLTGIVSPTVFVGSEPSKLVLTPDNQKLYVHLDGAFSIGSFDLATRTLTDSFPIGNDQYQGPHSLRDLSVAPDDSTVLAVARYYPNLSPPQIGAAIYRNGVRLPQTAPGHSIGSHYLTFGTTGSVLYGSNDRGVKTMAVTTNGVTAPANNDTSGPGLFSSIKLANGVIYTSAGQLIDPAAGTLIGTFPNSFTQSYLHGFVPDPSVGRAYYLVRVSNTYELRAYDLATFTLIGSLSIPNVSGEAGSLIRWGTNGIAFRSTGNQIFLIQTSLIPTANPLPDPPPAPTPTPNSTPAHATFVRKVNVSTNDMVHNPQTTELLVSVPGNAGFGLGNSITHINPETGSVGPSVFIGSEPNKIAASEDGQTLYAALHGANAIRRYNMASRTAGAQFSTSSIFWQPADIAVMPGYPDTIAVTTGSDGPGMFDNGVQRPGTSSIVSWINSLAFSNVSNILYGYNGYSSGFEVAKYTASGSGLTGELIGGRLLTGYQNRIKFSSGLLYSNTGRVLDPVTKRIKGTFPGTGDVMAIDAAQRKIFYLNQFVLTAYNMDTYVKIGSITLPAFSGTPTTMVRWGENGIAFRTGMSSSGTPTPIHIVQSSLISGAGTIPSGLQFSGNEYSANEGTGSVNVQVTRTGNVSGTSTVNYSTANGTAIAGTDYTAQSGTLTFNVGETVKIISILLLNENIFENFETFSVSLSNASVGSSVISPSTAIVTIANDDQRPLLSISGTTLAEPRTGNTASATLNVTLTNPSVETITVNYATTNGTALSGSDYVARSGMLTFAPMQMSQTISIEIVPDDALEPNETFTVNLSGPVNAFLSTSSANVVIQNTSNRISFFDYDGDRRADLSVRRPSDDNWYILRGTAGYMSMAFGEPGDLMVPADYDGDAKTDIAMFRPSTGQWFIFNSLSQTFVNYSWGASGDLPVPADHDGDGKSDLVVFRQSDGTWYRRLSNNTFSNVAFGVVGDKPVVGDFDGDGFYDIALYRPSDHNWYILKTGFGFFVQTWGEGADIPVPADYDGDGKTDVSVWRPSTGQWFRIQSTAGFGVVNWGQAGDMPIPADYDGDGKSDLAVFRPSTGTWYAIGSTNGFIQQQFGQNGDLPTQSAFIY